MRRTVLLMLALLLSGSACTSIINDYVALPGDGPPTDSMSEHDSSTDPDASTPSDTSMEQ